MHLESLQSLPVCLPRASVPLMGQFLSGATRKTCPGGQICLSNVCVDAGDRQSPCRYGGD